MVAAALPRKRFTRDEVEHMMDLGLFAGQRYELIDGDLIDKMGQLPRHANAIRRLLKLLEASCGSDRVQSQLPIEVASDEQRYTLPEPDFAVLNAAGTAELESRHPRGDELSLVVEISDSTLRYELAGKRDLYARAGVPEYWVLDLNGCTLAVFRNPERGKYTSTSTLTASEAVTVGGHSLRVSAMLPS